MFGGEGCISNWVYTWSRTPRVDHLLVEPFCFADYADGMPTNCLLGKRSIGVVLEGISTLLDAYPGLPKFAFLHSDDTHEPSLQQAKATDDAIHDFIERTLRDHPNTVVVLTSDHGMQYGNFYANSVQGKREQKLPALFFTMPGETLDSIPPSATKKSKNINESSSGSGSGGSGGKDGEGGITGQGSGSAPESSTVASSSSTTDPRTVLRRNQLSLTTHYDMHATLSHLAMRWSDPQWQYPNATESFDWSGVQNYGKDPKLSTRTDQIPTVYPYSTSLLFPIPIERTCKEAAVPPMWCVCGEPKPLDTEGKLASQVAEFAMNSFASGLKPELRDGGVCAKLALRKVILAEVSISKIPIASEITEDKQDYLTTATYRITFAASDADRPERSPATFEVDVRAGDGSAGDDLVLDLSDAQVVHIYRLDTYADEKCKADMDRDDHNRCMCAAVP